MGTRLELQQILVGLLGSDNVYFQPPPSIKMVYPCIMYKRDYAETKFSGNKPYFHQTRYLVTVIDKNPDSLIPDKIAKLPMCLFDRFYTADNLNHNVYKLFF
jgi:hypothetical protein